jgi:hypothetical protein
VGVLTECGVMQFYRGTEQTCHPWLLSRRLAGMACRTQGRGDCRAGGGGNRRTEDALMKKPANETKPSTVVANDPEDLKGMLKAIGGSRCDHWNNILANQTHDGE